MELGCVELEELEYIELEYIELEYIELEYVELKYMEAGSSTIPLAISKSTIKRECVPYLYIIKSLTR